MAELDAALCGTGFVRHLADGTFEHVPAQEIFADEIGVEAMRNSPIGSPERKAWQAQQNRRYRRILESMAACPHGVRDPRACHKCNPGDGARSL